MCNLHMENELLMHSVKSVGKTMKTNIRVVHCFTLFGAHQHDKYTSHLVSSFSFSMEKGVVQVSCIALFIYGGLRVFMIAMDI